MPQSESQPGNPTPQVEEVPPRNITTSIQSLLFVGPLPLPSILAGYNSIVPGAAERIIAIAENEAAHQREMERFVLEQKFKQAKHGQVFALTIAVVALATSGFLGFTGHELPQVL